MWVFACFMEKPAGRQAEPPRLEAQLIEQPAPAATRSGPPGKPAAPRQTKPKQQARRPAPEAPAPAIRQAEQSLLSPKPETAPSNNVSVAVAPSEGQAGTGKDSSGLAWSGPGGGRASGSATGGSTGQGGPGEGTGGGGNMFASSGARAIIRPMPQIPDDLRGEAFNSVALARFHVTVDGSATVELARPTPNPRINHILLETLKKWRFMPAIRNGRPVPSTEDVLIKIEVK
jgi:protein TonB